MLKFKHNTEIVLLRQCFGHNLTLSPLDFPAVLIVPTAIELSDRQCL